MEFTPCFVREEHFAMGSIQFTAFLIDFYVVSKTVIDRCKSLTANQWFQAYNELVIKAHAIQVDC